MSDINPLLLTDVYKMGHMEQYKPGTNKVYSYLIARKGNKLPKVLFFGLQYYLKKYLGIRITAEHVQEFLKYRKRILGTEAPQHIVDKLNKLVEDGFFSLKIKAVPEGAIVPAGNILASVTNTKDHAYWQVGFIESLLLKVWNTCTVASYSRKLKDLVSKFGQETCDNLSHVPFAVHDFGYRGVSSEETAALSGAAHLINFLGSDTVPAIKFLDDHYEGNKSKFVGLSVPAGEHSCACSYGREGELDYFKRMLEIYPAGIVSIISDTYDLWNVLTNFAVQLKDQILNRTGKVVFRPDSGNPLHIICGDPNAPEGSPEKKGALALLGEVFGYTVNQKGYKVLNPQVGLIYGDGFYYERFELVLQTMKEQGWATSNLVVGIGGLLLQNHNRDEQGYAFKATYSEVNGIPQELFKDPITDPGKKSHKGLMRLDYQIVDNNYVWKTTDQVSWEEEAKGELKEVFLNGEQKSFHTLESIRMLSSMM